MAYCPLFVGSISISIDHKVLEEVDGDWGVTHFHLWALFQLVVEPRTARDNFLGKILF